jgi:hypothetical protein
MAIAKRTSARHARFSPKCWRIDSREMVNSIRNLLENVPAVRLRVCIVPVPGDARRKNVTDPSVAVLKSWNMFFRVV